MTNTVLLKRSSVANAIPLAGDLQYGELAINYNDGSLYFKNTANAVVTLASTQSLSVTGNVTGGNIVTSGNVSATGNISADYFLGNASQLTDIVAFKTISVPGNSNIVANATGNLNVVAGDNITLTTDPATGTLTISGLGSDIWITGGSMGTVVQAVTVTYDFGSVTTIATTDYDLGYVVESGLIWPTDFKLPSSTVINLPVGAPAGSMVYVPDASGGSIPAFSDGTDWRRVDTRAVVT